MFNFFPSALKPQFAADPDIQELSSKFIMINTQVS